MASSSAMDVDRPKIDVDAYLTKAASASPASLRSYFEAFGNLHRRKSVPDLPFLKLVQNYMLI
jgi:hypothetical protein